MTDPRLTDACILIADGATLAQAASAVGCDRRTLLRLSVQDPESALMYARAREASGDALADEALALTRTATNENAQAIRVQFDALRWLAGKRNRGIYGEHQQLQVNARKELTVRVVDEREPLPRHRDAQALPPGVADAVGVEIANSIDGNELA